jgi:hypothetical protein
VLASLPEIVRAFFYALPQHREPGPILAGESRLKWIHTIVIMP